MKKIIIASILSVFLQWSVFAQTTTIKVGSSTRNMIVIAPSGLSNPAMIIQMHGMNQDAAYQKNASKWETIAEREKIIVVFPNGNNKSWDISGNTDIDFLKTIIDTMYNRYKIDRNRVYASGFSMGGMMSYHVANKMADKIAAIAPCSGYLFNNTASSSRPMPIIHIHGDADDVVAYSGVAGVIEAWRKNNGCPATAVTTKPYPSTKANSVTTKQYWGPGTDNSSIVLLTNKGKGHWYSMDEATGTNSSEEIWSFFKQYSLAKTNSLSNTTKAQQKSSTKFTCENSILKMQFNNTVSDVNTLNIFDLKGQLVKTFSIQTKGISQEFNISGISKGFYILKICNGIVTVDESQLLLSK
jgi:poly(3-hydroxybutyrate) depolymerase